MSKYKTLFLRQSYLDGYEAYELSLTESKRRPQPWDYIILTASNEAQAQSYREQINYRLENGKLPKSTHYAVIPDPDGKRVGSGGATLNVLRYIRERENSFTGKKILVIHSGGDSKRVPQYSVCGKIFSPVPRLLPDGRRSTLFDEFIIGMTTVPTRMEDGMLVCSGDVLLLFNPLQIDFYGGGAAALSIKEHVSTGKNHGVFLGDENGKVGSFLHKQTEEKLASLGAVDGRGNVDIDTGAVIFGSKILDGLYALVDTESGARAYINEHVRLSFYADFLYPLASDSTEEQYYKEIPEGDFSPELTACRRELWRVLSGFEMKLIRLSPASFIHFGTTRELLHLMTEEIQSFSFLDWSSLVNTNCTRTGFAASHSYVSRRAEVGNGSYIEDSYIHKNTVIGKNCVISGVTLDGEVIPDETVLHGLKLSDGRFTVRMYGVNDNPKEAKWFGESIPEALWEYSVFPVCDTMDEAVKKVLSRKKTETMLSLRESFAQADPTALIPWQKMLDDRIKVESLLAAIDNRISADEAAEIFKNGISERTLSYLLSYAEKLSSDDLAEFGKKIRIYYYLSHVVTGELHERYLASCFDTISEAVTNASKDAIIYREDAKIAKDEVITRLPVRVNFGGGWSDTPPYCLENGGVVLNAAITLNGQYPIEVVLKRLDENKIILTSADHGSYREFTDLAPLVDCKNPADPFALHKAALIACGIIPASADKYTLSDITGNLGGGVYLSTRVYGIPRGSGLGTSSILAGACVKGIFEFLGVDYTEDELYYRVMCMEQLMSTGGGWQDQVGGLTMGIKMLNSSPGISQKIRCTPLHIAPEVIDEFNSRYAIIYTGQRRLARNLLREVVGKYIGANKDTVEALYEIQRVAVLMRFELEKGNIDGFAELLSHHWELSQKIDANCNNTCIDQIFRVIDDLIDGRMICGAGGGGFLQVILKKGVSKEKLQERIKDVFADTDIGVWNCSLV